MTKDTQDGDRFVTVEQFVALLKNIVGLQGKMEQIDYDTLRGQELISRRTAAGIIHHVLLSQGEEDEEHMEAAFRLRDLYSCRTCVNHIAQVYAKGIMMEWEAAVFGVNEKITGKEAGEILMRARDRQLRIKPEPPGPARWTTILWQEAEAMLKADRRILLVDVRSEEEYRRGHREGSVNVPLDALLKNPYGVCADRAAAIFLYCQKGYKSRIAAGLLTEAGYVDVHVIL